MQAQALRRVLQYNSYKVSVPETAIGSRTPRRVGIGARNGVVRRSCVAVGGRTSPGFNQYHLLSDCHL
jgi:hypothetical protein